MAVDLAITPDGRWEATTAELVTAASETEFSALGVAGSRVDRTTVAAYRGAGLACHEVLALVITADEEATLAAAAELAGAAATMAAPWVLTVFASPLTAATAKTIERCAATFAEVGAGLAVEFSPLGPVGAIPQGLDVVRAANRGAGRAGLMIDAWHFSFGESTWADLANLDVDDIAYIQFTDALPPESANLVAETMHRRALPGEGMLELDRFASTLLELGYDGIVSVEVLNEDLRTLPADEIARRIHATTAPYWH